MKPGLRYRLPPMPPEGRREGLVRELRSFVAVWRQTCLEGARLFNAIARLGVHLHEGASSVASLAEEAGMSFQAALEVERVGQAMWRWPKNAEHVGAADDLASGRMRLDNAAVLGRVDMEDDFLREDDDWPLWARTMTPRAFLRAYRTRVEEVRRGGPVQLLGLRVPWLSIDRFETARKHASRSVRRVMTQGEAFDAIVDFYLERNHVLYQPEAARRAGDTSECPGSRYIPAAVRRAVLRRWDHCAVPFCHNDMFLQFSHRKPHREGGSREEDNLDLLCGWHHTLYEQGILLIDGPPDDPTFRTREGRVIGEGDSNVDLYDANLRMYDAQVEAEREERRRDAAKLAAADAQIREFMDKAKNVFAALTTETGTAVGPEGAPPPPAGPPASGSEVPEIPTDERAYQAWLTDALYPRKGEGFGIWPVP